MIHKLKLYDPALPFAVALFFSVNGLSGSRAFIKWNYRKAPARPQAKKTSQPGSLRSSIEKLNKD
jgi:hypothetical protein